MGKKRTPPEICAGVETIGPYANACNTLEELQGFHAYAYGLRCLWHWIELLETTPDKTTYFHEVVNEEIELGDGLFFCPGTESLPIAPSFPNAKTPKERSLEIALYQCSFVYFSSMQETVVDNVDRLCESVKFCEPYRQKIRLAVARAKHRDKYHCDWRTNTLERSANFRQSWQEVADILGELFFLVDTELHTEAIKANGKYETKTERMETPSFSNWMRKSEIQKLLEERWGCWRTLKNNSGKPGHPEIESHRSNTQFARYRLP